MNETEKRERTQLIADTVQYLLQQIDMFVNAMTAEDIDILIECKDKLQEKILNNESAMALILALRRKLR